MTNIWSALAYLLVLSSEMILYMVGAWYLGKYLNQNHTALFDWIMLTVPLSVVLCIYAGYRFFDKLIKSQNKKE